MRTATCVLALTSALLLAGCGTKERGRVENSAGAGAATGAGIGAFGGPVGAAAGAVIGGGAGAITGATTTPRQINLGNGPIDNPNARIAGHPINK